MFDAPKGVPESLLYSSDYNRIEFRAALGTLLSFSMVSVGPDGSILMHAMVQQAVRGFIARRGTVEEYLLEASTRIPTALTFASMRPWQYYEQIAAHGDEVLRFISTLGAVQKQLLLTRATLLYYMAGYRKFCAQYTMALPKLKKHTIFATKPLEVAIRKPSIAWSLLQLYFSINANTRLQKPNREVLLRRACG
jgi:hypothetical protein